MPRDIREPYRFSLSIASTLDYLPSSQPDRGKLRESADWFASQIRHALTSEFAGEVLVSTEYVQLGSGYFGHSARMSLESREEWERACRVFSQFTDDWEDILASKLAVHEFLEREDVLVRIHPQTDAPPVPQPPPNPSDNGATTTLRREQKRVKKAMKSERKRMRRLLFNMAWAALAFGIVASAAWWLFWFTHEELRLLREELQSRPPAVQGSAAAPPVVVVYPPPSATQSTRPIVREPRVYRSNPE